MTKEPETMFVVEKGIPGIRVLPISQPVAILGASPSSDIFVDNPYISRSHMQLVREGDRYRIRDLASKNGTHINGSPISGDGQLLLRFQTRGTTVLLPQASSSEDGDLVVDSKSREVWVRGAQLDSPLSRKEFDVLELLYEKRGEACSKDAIATVGWPERNGGDVGDQEIEQSIRRLRLRVESDPSQPEYVITVRGYGYKLAAR